jgi:hypothetical protein
MTPGAIGVVPMAITMGYVAIGFFFIKVFMAHYPDSLIAKALAFIFN